MCLCVYLYVCVLRYSVMSNSLQCLGLWPARLHCLWDSPRNWNGFPFPPSGDLPDPEINLVSLMSPIMAGVSLP